MKKLTLALAAVAMLSFASNAQIKKTSTASVTFDATTPNDAWPKATNNLVNCAINTKSGKIEFKLDVNNFSFKDNNAMIKEHWLDPKVMNGAKFPKATFGGKITDMSAVKFNVDGTYDVNVAGTLTIHGVKKQITTPGKVMVKGSEVMLSAGFIIKSIDYGISHPGESAGKVSSTPSISISATLN